MTVESPADRLTFLSPAEFGDTATYTPAGGSAVPGIAGIFNRPHVDTSVSVSSFDVTTSDTRPTFICRSADLPPPAQGGDAGDTLAIGVDTYRVLDLQPDGTGMTVVELGRGHPMHTRKLIRDAVAALVTGLPTTASRVLVGRTRPLAAGHLPTLLIYTTEEQSDRPMEGNPGGLGRDLQLSIEGRVSTATPPDDLLDAIAFELEGKLRDTDLDGLVFDITLLRTTVDVTADGERHTGAIRFEYHVRYSEPDEQE